MAIPIAKLTILVGAGIVGTILTKEGRLGDVSSFISGAFKVVRKHLQEDKGNHSSSSSKPATDYLLTQVNSLRQQLQNLQSSGSITIVSESRSGSGTYRLTAIILVGAAGYGYAWWKGWKISDMMYVTKRRWLDARENVAKQVDQVSSSVTSTKKELSSKIDCVNCSLEDCLEVTVATKEEVSELHSDISGFHVEVESVHRAVQSLGSKLVKIEGTQDFTTNGLYHLCEIAKKLESRRAENPPMLTSNVTDLNNTRIDRVSSLPPTISVSEPPSPSRVETPRVVQSSRTARADSFKEVHGLTSWTSLVRTASGASSSTESSMYMLPKGEPSLTDRPKNNGSGSSTSVLLGWRLPSLNILTRSRSSTDAS